MKNYRNEDAFLELVRSSIWGKAPDLDFFKNLTEFDWLEIYMIAGRQTVLGICLKAIMELPNSLKPPTKLLLQWVGINRYIEANNYKIQQVWQDLNAKFEEAGIHPVVLKGMTVAKWYAHPMSRQSSDIDIFIADGFNHAIDLVKSWGLDCKHKPQHDTIVYKGVTIEIHPHIFTVPFRPKFAHSVHQETVANNLQVNVLDPNTNSLLLLSHAAGHFLIPGIGYRFLCDWAVFLKNNHEQIDRELVLREAKKMGMHRFVREFTKLAEVALSLKIPGLNKWTEGSSEKYLLKLSDELFEQGDFGAVNFQKDYKGNKFQFRVHLLKSLWATRYYWPKLFWVRAPKHICKLVFNKLFPPKKEKK